MSSFHLSRFSASLCHSLPLSASLCHSLPLSASLCHSLPLRAFDCCPSAILAPSLYPVSTSHSSVCVCKYVVHTHEYAHGPALSVDGSAVKLTTRSQCTHYKLTGPGKFQIGPCLVPLQELTTNSGYLRDSASKADEERRGWHLLRDRLPTPAATRATGWRKCTLSEPWIETASRWFS